MEQREEGAGAPAAAVVRQLDFTVNLIAAENANARGNSLFPAHRQDELQSKWLEAEKSQYAHVNARPQSPSRPVTQTKLPPRKMVMPLKSPHQEFPQIEGKAKSPLITTRLVNPGRKPVSMPKRALEPSVKMQSSKREGSNLEQNVTPKKQKQCRCKNSRCLKMYCECFASGVYCDGCNCINCYNKQENEADRKEAIDTILERKPDAFHGVENNRGCNCKRTGCLKKYCECFQANILCSDKCKCMDCKNFEGSEERKLRLYHPSADPVAFIQRTNAAMHGAVGTPSKKIRNQQIGFDVASIRRVSSFLPKSHQENCSMSNTSYSPLSVQLSKPNSTKLGLPKASYRSPLSGVLQLLHVEDFCKHLVEVTIKATKNPPEETKRIDDDIDMNRAETSVGCHEDSKHHQRQQLAVELPQRDRTSLCELEGHDIQNGRPLSPSTLALMCNERDATFLAANAPSTVPESNRRTNSASASPLGHNQLRVERERLVLASFRDFLNRLITCGSIEERRVEQENPKDQGSNGV